MNHDFHERTPETIAEELLVLQAKNGDRKALQMLANRVQARLLAHARQVTERKDVAADVVQDAWLAIMRGIGRLRDPAAFRGWAMQIVHRRAVDWVRQQSKQRRATDEIIRRQPTGAAQDSVGADALNQRDDTEILQLAIRQLSPDEKLLLRMYYTERIRIKQIARITGIVEGTVKYKLFQLRQRLKELTQATKRRNDDDQN